MSNLRTQTQVLSSVGSRAVFYPVNIPTPIFQQGIARINELISSGFQSSYLVFSNNCAHMTLKFLNFAFGMRLHGSVRLAPLHAVKIVVKRGYINDSTWTRNYRRIEEQRKINFPEKSETDKNCITCKIVSQKPLLRFVPKKLQPGSRNIFSRKRRSSP